MYRLDLKTILLAAALATGCVGRVGYRATVWTDVYQPDLVYVAPGVQVIADYNEPIFYADNFYWRFYGGTWYRSSYYSGGWVYATPPAVVLRVERPHMYAHYRPQGWTPRRGPVVRDHRQAPPPVVRDHRQARPRPNRR